MGLDIECALTLASHKLGKAQNEINYTLNRGEISQESRLFV